MKRTFFQAVVISILLYGCTTWTLRKCVEKKLDGNYTRMLRAILNKSWRQRPTKQNMYGHLLPITNTTEVDEPDIQDTAGEEGTNSYAIFSCGPLHMDKQKQDDLQEPIYKSSVPIRGVVLKTFREPWAIEMGGERGSGRSVLPARHDYDDDDDLASDLMISKL